MDKQKVKKKNELFNKIIDLTSEVKIAAYPAPSYMYERMKRGYLIACYLNEVYALEDRSKTTYRDPEFTFGIYREGANAFNFKGFKKVVELDAISLASDSYEDVIQSILHELEHNKKMNKNGGMYPSIDTAKKSMYIHHAPYFDADMIEYNADMKSYKKYHK